MCVACLQRIVTDLQEVVQARGLSLAQQVAMPGGSASNLGTSNGSGNGAGGGSGGLPLSLLLGGSLVDRMDLLGRTGEVPCWQR